jgi:hypothetical protein
MSEDVINEETNEEITEVEITALSAEEELKRVTEELNKKQDLIRQLRKYEKSQKEQAQKALEEQGKYRELYEAANEKLTAFEKELINSKIDAALDTELKNSNARSIETVKKLIDRSTIDVSEDGVVSSESIKAIISQLQETDAVLFDSPVINTPVIKRASEETSVVSFETELRNAKSQKDITAVLKKYNKI